MNHSAILTPDKFPVSGKQPSYQQSAGPLPYTLTNDYLFKALLQENETVLKHLICSLLRLRPEEVESVVIKNPIMLRKTLPKEQDSKTFVLDVNVLLNNHTIINLEMQVINYKNWPERALSYLCRNFDHLSRGEDYINVRPTIHIGFLDFTLFPDYPEFYSTCKMMNVKNHHIFTDKIALSVVDLKQIDLATPEDREWETDYWASLFKAATWEELKMLAQKSPNIENAVTAIYDLTADEAIQEQCKAREKQLREMKTILKERDIAVQERDAAAQERDAAVQERNTAAQERDAAVQERDTAAQERDAAVQERDTAAQERDAAVQRLEKTASELDRTVQEKNEAMRQLELLKQENDRLRGQR